MLERKINSLSVDMNGYVDCAHRAQLRLLAFNAKIAAMDNERVQILAKKEILIATYTGNVLFAIDTAKAICAQSAFVEAPTCIEVKKNTCDNIKKRFITNLTQYNLEVLPKYLNNPEYIQLKAHDKTYMEPLDATKIIGKDNLDSIDCDLTASSERIISFENRLLAQETNTI